MSLKADSLRLELNKLIQSYNGDIVPYDKCWELTIKLSYQRGKNYKQSNMERRLRESESPAVMTMVNSKNYIIGYAWKHKNFEKPKMSLEKA